MLRAVVIVLGVLIVIALGVLVTGLVMKFSTNSRSAGPPALALPRGAKILEMHAQPNRLILRIRASGEDEILVVDTGDGHLVTRIKAADAK